MAAFSLVELLVVMSIVTVFTAFAGMAYVRATRLERNLRTEAFARTRLVLDLERIARGLSLAKDIEWVDTNGTIIADSRNLKPGTNYAVRLSFPEETGGVSFETNRITKVSSLRFTVGLDAILAMASNRIDLVSNVRTNILESAPVFITGEPTAFSRITMTNAVDQEGVSVSNLLHVTLASIVYLDDGGGKTREKEVSVDRLVRMWNR